MKAFTTDPMKTSPSPSLGLRRFLVQALDAAGALAALPTQAQYSIFSPSGVFDINITLGCDCTCWCATNNIATNNAVGAFLASNPVKWVYANASLAPLHQVVPPHWTLFPGANYTTPADDPFYLEGWTETTSYYPLSWGTGLQLLSPPFNLSVPINFAFPFYYYQDALPALGGGTGPGDNPVQNQIAPQPYPWDVNVTLQLANHQLYVMEQQLAVGYWPLDYDLSFTPAQELDSPVDYSETNGLLTITLQCADGTPVQIVSATITATLKSLNIPLPLNEALGASFSSDLFTNWSWPLTFGDQPFPFGPNGSAGTVQASLAIGTVNGTTQIGRAHV